MASVDEGFRIDFCNIRGLETNFFAMYAHMFQKQPHLMAVCETQVRGDNPENFNMPGYSLLPFFFPRRGLALYIRNDVAYQCQQQYNMSDPEFSAFWVKLKIQMRIIHFCFIYRSPNTNRDHTLSGLESMSSSISSILAHHPQSEIVAAGDFNMLNTQKTDLNKVTKQMLLNKRLFSNLFRILFNIKQSFVW